MERKGEAGEYREDKYVRILKGKYRGCIGKVVYEYEHFKGFYLVEINGKEIVLTGNNLRWISSDEAVEQMNKCL